jgi:hypothetical protein
VYDTFCDSKTRVVFAIDIAARRLDFQKADWIVQADFSEDGEEKVGLNLIIPDSPKSKQNMTPRTCLHSKTKVSNVLEQTDVSSTLVSETRETFQALFFSVSVTL